MENTLCAALGRLLDGHSPSSWMAKTVTPRIFSFLPALWHRGRLFLFTNMTMRKKFSLSKKEELQSSSGTNGRWPVHGPLSSYRVTPGFQQQTPAITTFTNLPYFHATDTNNTCVPSV